MTWAAPVRFVGLLCRDKIGVVSLQSCNPALLPCAFCHAQPPPGRAALTPTQELDPSSMSVAYERPWFPSQMPPTPRQELRGNPLKTCRASQPWLPGGFNSRQTLTLSQSEWLEIRGQGAGRVGSLYSPCANLGSAISLRSLGSLRENSTGNQDLGAGCACCHRSVVALFSAWEGKKILVCTNLCTHTYP